ncbi:uncharacterized protein LOC133520194 isoform X2 [Cydia pomonella]|uniref:uncharacterized protein LOC133520194 isoform X2 n=1 Tax=Cydia pomonella TaxID=82600 RepID=UPI002ADD7245|nr:uncharacterized protein LOC133520194 isoform X2 [Cydia pomonella]
MRGVPSKECRLHVQKLNGIRADIDANATSCASDTSGTSNTTENPEQNEILYCSVAKKSKWLDYLDTEENSHTEENEQISDETMLLNNTEIVLELPKKCKRKSYTSTRILNKPKSECFSEDFSQPLTTSNDDKKSNNITTAMDRTKSVIYTCTADTAHYVPEASIINNSKWAKLVDNTQNCEDEYSKDPITYNIFTLNPIQDEELDSVLDL